MVRLLSQVQYTLPWSVKVSLRWKNYKCPILNRSGFIKRLILNTPLTIAWVHFPITMILDCGWIQYPSFNTSHFVKNFNTKVF